MRLELVRLSCQGELVGDPVQANTCFEKSGVILQCFEHGKASRTSTHDHHPPLIHQHLVSQVTSSTDRILYIIDPPIPPQQVAVITSITGTTTVINIQHGITAAGEKLHSRVESRPALAGWSTMHHYPQGWQPNPIEGIVFWWVIKPI